MPLEVQYNAKEKRWMSYASILSHRGSFYLDVVFWKGARLVVFIELARGV